jgi:predicted glycoside hydrolase/deacetylase ChbG (UPF0249 family)
MVFMADSKRAADHAKDCGIDIGLHINFTEGFTASVVPTTARKYHGQVSRFLRMNKYALLVYNPLLLHPMRHLFEIQLDEFRRLYDREPCHIDGHQHMHLCTNMVVHGIIPAGLRVRRSFSFEPGQKSALNRAYRGLVDRRLARRYRLTDYFFALSQCMTTSRLRHVFMLAERHDVELMTHPEVKAEYDFLLSEQYFDLFSAAMTPRCQPR